MFPRGIERDLRVIKTEYFSYAKIPEVQWLCNENFKFWDLQTFPTAGQLSLLTVSIPLASKQVLSDLKFRTYNQRNASSWLKHTVDTPWNRVVGTDANYKFDRYVSLITKNDYLRTRFT